MPVAGAIAKTYEKHLTGITLIESGSHAPVTFTPAPPGTAPAMMTGHLRGSVTMAGPTGGGGIGRASVSPHTIYAATQEWGGVHEAVNGPYMWLWIRYLGMRGVLAHGWLRERVEIPARPYMRTAVAETIASGELQHAGEAAFEAAVWGRDLIWTGGRRWLSFPGVRARLHSDIPGPTSTPLTLRAESALHFAEANLLAAESVGASPGPDQRPARQDHRDRCRCRRGRCGECRCCRRGDHGGGR